MNRIVSVFFILLSAGFLSAQSFTAQNPSVTVNGRTLTNGFTGGMQNPQFWGMNLNDDGLEDLIVFESHGSRFMPFLTIQDGPRIRYQYAPEYLHRFPEANDWIVMRDYNGDGRKDMFAHSLETQSVNGIELFKQLEDGTFELVPVNGENHDILYYTKNDGKRVNVYVTFEDLPDINDVDGDGDLDVLSFQPEGNILNFYKNLSVENNLGPDEFDFELNTECWGGFFESENSDEVTLSSTKGECATGVQGPNKTRGGSVHAGSTSLTFDQDNDGLPDLILGDLTSNGLVFLENGGSIDEAWMVSQDAHFPTYDISADLPIFLATFLYDVNKDGIDDLLVAPNTPIGADVNSSWYYIGFKQGEEQLFSLEQTDFLLSTMVDIGLGCSPTFADYNQDGLMDIIAGNDIIKGDTSRVSSLYLFENTGTLDRPSFTLVDEDYQGLEEFSGFSSGENVSHYAPAIGDLDGDGDEDMLVGGVEGQFMFLENTAGPNKPYEFAEPVFKFMGLDPGGNTVPAIYDVNGDGLGDLIIGEENNNNDVNGDACGSIDYYENVGSLGNPVFAKDQYAPTNNVCFGEVLFRKFGGSLDGSPYVVEYPNGPRLYFGTNQGIKVMEGLSAERGAVFDVIDEKFGNLHTSETHRIAMYDINNDGAMDALIGHKSGGFTLWTTPHLVDGSVNTKDIGLQPDILMNTLVEGKLRLTKLEKGEYHIVSLDGRIQQSGVISEYIDVRALSPGLYVLVLESEQGSYSAKWVKTDR